MRTTALAGVSSVGLAAIKITTGYFGNSYALIADGIESLTDIVGSVAVLLGLAFSVRPADERHPYGYGKLETLAALFVAVLIISAATLIGWQSIKEIETPHHSPKWFTLPVLALVVLVKLAASRMVGLGGAAHGSEAMKAESWHHATDAITSGAAFVGISIALLGKGDHWASADDWATLVACSVIYLNGFRLARNGISELLDKSPEPEVCADLRSIASAVAEVRCIEKMRVRRSGLGLLMDIHVQVDPGMSVERGHEIAHNVQAALHASPHHIADVTVHIEPYLPGK